MMNTTVRSNPGGPVMRRSASAIELIGDYHASCVRRVISRQTTVARLSLDYAIAGARATPSNSNYAPALASHLRGCPRCKVLGGAGAMRAGVPMLRDVIAPVLLLFDAGDATRYSSELSAISNGH